MRSTVGLKSKATFPPTVCPIPVPTAVAAPLAVLSVKRALPLKPKSSPVAGRKSMPVRAWPVDPSRFTAVGLAVLKLTSCCPLPATLTRP
jgi:hypothetical protein